MTACDIKIMAVPDREANINRLKSKLCLTNKDVFIDLEHRKNPLWTWCQTMSLPKKSNISHRLILQDDAIVCEDLYEFCNMLVSKYTHSVIVLYNRADKLEKTNKHSYLYKTQISFGGVANIIPFEIYDDFYDEYQNDFYNFVSDDNALHYWCVKHNYSIIKVFPTIIETTDTVSIMGNKPVGHQNKFINKPLQYSWPLLNDERECFWVAKLDKINHTLTS